MPIQFPDFGRISFNEANPWMVGAERGQQFAQNAFQFPQDLQSKMLANQIAQVQAQYAQPMAAEGLTAAKQQNQYNPRLWESQIGYQGAQTGLTNQQSKYYGQNINSEMAARAATARLQETEAAKNKFLMENPQYINADAALITQAIQNQQRQQGGQQPPMGNQGGMPGGGQAPQMGGGQPPPQMGGQQQPPQGGGQQQSQMNMPPMQPNGPQYSPMQYSPDALAFSPPQIPSPTGNPGLDNMYYKKFGMSPIVQTQLDLAKSQAEKYQTQNIERNKEFNNQAVTANQMTLDAHKFLDALDRSYAIGRGAVGGRGPAMSDAAQEMDAYSNNMASGTAKLFQNDKAVHQSDIELAQMSKANRKQNKAVSFDLAQGVIAKNDRMKEKQMFYAQGTNPPINLKPEILDAMWNKYETERPYINTETKMPNDAYKDTWHDYLNPEAVNEFVHGKSYSFPNQKQLQQANWSKTDLTKVGEWAKKNGFKPEDFNKENLYRLAKNENISLAQLKQELIQRGAKL